MSLTRCESHHLVAALIVAFAGGASAFVQPSTFMVGGRASSLQPGARSTMPHAGVRLPTGTNILQDSKGPTRSRVTSRFGTIDMMAAEKGNRVVILGGGFGGLYTALNLAKLAPLQGEAKPDVTLIDTSNRFVFLPMLYELVTGELKDWEVAPVFSDLLKDTGVKFLQGKVIERDGKDRTVSVEVASVAGGGSRTVAYDHLVVSLGSQSTLSEVDGAAEHAIPFQRVDDAVRLRERMDQALAKGGVASVVIVGGGYSGVELACNIADRYGDKAKVTLVHRGDKVLEPAQLHNRDTGARKMSSVGVQAMMRTSVECVKAGSITLRDADGTVFDEACDVCVWTAGVRASEQVKKLGFKTTDEGRITVNPRLKVLGEDGVYALGDIADCKDVLQDRAGATAQVALQQADTVAWNIHAQMTGGIPISFRYQNLGEMLTLGSESASLASSLFGLNVKGPAAHALRRAAYLIRMPTNSHKIKVAGSWAERFPKDVVKSLLSRSSSS